MKTLLFCLIMLGAVAPCNAQNIEMCRWNFDPPTTGTLMPTSVNASLVSGGDFSWGPGCTWSNWIAGASLDPVNDKAPSIQDWPVGPAPYDTTRWIGGEVTTVPGKVWQPTALKGRFSRTSGAPTTYEMRVSLDEWQTSEVVSSWYNSASNDWDSHIINIDLSALPSIFGGEMFSFRLYGREANAFNGRVKVDSLRVIGQELLPLSARVFLEGPLVGVSMNDDLRTLGMLPMTDPYGQSSNVLPAVFSAVGDDAIVDWVKVELRSSADPAIVVATQAALLQRDGDVVSTDGMREPTFAVPMGAYYVAIKHRNHLPVMTASSVSPGSLIDFTSPTLPTWGTDAQTVVGGQLAMWAGDVSGDGMVKYTGATNDRDPILVDVGSTTPNSTVSGYLTSDVNMDGMVKYTGATNDRDPILVNVGGVIPNNVRAILLP